MSADYGTIGQRGYNSYVWIIPDFINAIRKYDSLWSTEFVLDVNNTSWRLNLYIKKNLSGYGTTMYFKLALFDGIPMGTIDYSVCIQNIRGEDYWISPSVAEKFDEIDLPSFDENIKCNELSCTVLQVSAEDLLSDRSMIVTSNGCISVHLTFFPNPRRGILIPKNIKVSELYNTTEETQITSSTETSSNILDNQGSSCLIDDHDQLVQNFTDLMVTGQNSDVTLIVKGKDAVEKEFKAHKNILMCRSLVFGRMFENSMVEHSNGSVEITDCDANIFQIFLLYLYTGKVEKLTVDSAIKLYFIADKYAVKSLTPHCKKFLLNNLSVESFCDIVMLGLLHSELELLESAKVFLAQNMQEIIATDKWKAFNAENSDEATELLNKALSKVRLTPL